MPVLQNLKKFTFCAKLCGSEVINKCNPEVRRKTEALNNMKTAQYWPIIRNGKDDFLYCFRTHRIVTIILLPWSSIIIILVYVGGLPVMITLLAPPASLK